MRPFQTQPKRIPTFPNVDRTAVVDFNRPGTISIGAAGEHRVLLSRQPVYPLWTPRTFPNPLGYAVGYLPKSYDSSAVYLGSPHQSVMLENSSNYIAASWAGDNPTDTGRPQFEAPAPLVQDPSYTAPIMGFDTKLGPEPFIYVPEESNFYFSATFPNVTYTSLSYWVLGYEVFNRPGEVIELQTEPLLGDGTTFTIIGRVNATGWIRPTSFARRDAIFTSSAQPVLWFYVLPGAPAVTLTQSTTERYPILLVDSVGTGVVTMPVPFPTDYWVSSNPFSDTRVTAAALNIENVTKVLDKEGTIMCGRVNPATQNPLTVTDTTIATYHPLEKVQLALQYGVYTFTVPSVEGEQYKDYILPLRFYRGAVGGYVTSNGVPAMDIGSTAYWHAMIFADPDGGTKLSYSVDWHLEFRTTSTLWNVDISRDTLESYHRAVTSLYRHPFFTRANTNNRLQAPRTQFPAGTVARSKRDRRPKGQRQQGPPPPSNRKPTQPVQPKPKPKPKASAPEASRKK